jgi:hypothetical protein
MTDTPPEPTLRDDHPQELGGHPPPGAEWVEEHEPPRTEAERQALETIRSVSRLEESN